MIGGLDSSTVPTAAQVAQARAAGVRLWAGYLATKAEVRLYNVWTRDQFDIARGCGATPIAYASGLDDPIACKALAAAWNVRLCLDVEGGIRGDGPWVQAWLDASGAGVYGNAGVHGHTTAPFHIYCGYFGTAPGHDYGVTWPSWVPHPGGPVAWQFANTHNEFGVGVDRNWFDDWFNSQGEDMLTDSLKRTLVRLAAIAGLGHEPSPAQLDMFAGAIKDDGTNVEAIITSLIDSPEGIGWGAHLNAKGAQGLKGDPGPAGKDGAAVVAPGTTITSTVR